MGDRIQLKLIAEAEEVKLSPLLGLRESLDFLTQPTGICWTSSSRVVIE